MKGLIVTILIAINFTLNAQNRNNIWCFGDSAGIDFSNLSSPIPIHSSVKSRGSCVSICDSSSNLLFYAYTRAATSGNTTLVKNRFDSLMQNGDNIIGEGWYMELVTLPFPNDSNKYYLFSTGVAGSSLKGLYYSVIEMLLDSGRGAVTQKNIQLLPDKANDGLTVVKHGNGRDWWLIHRKYLGSNNTFYKFLISPGGISPPDTQNIGTLTATNTSRYIFNKEGNKLGMVMYDGTIETFDFDRCTGVLSNHILIRPKNTVPPAPGLWSCAFSPNNRFLYISAEGNPTSYLMQIDLQDSTPWASADTIWKDSVYAWFAGALRLAPDNKIYFACTWYDGTFNYPYPDTLSNYVINNLSVINSPDSLGMACNFTPFSFYLGGSRTYVGLPNNPDYDLPRLQGSLCDTIQWAAVQNIEPPKGEMYVSYIKDWQKAFINAQHLKGTTYTLSVIDITGRQIFKEKGRLRPPYFTKDLDCSRYSKGMYIVSLQTDKEILAKKFVKN